MGITDGVVGTPPGMTDAVNWAVYLVTCGVQHIPSRHSQHTHGDVYLVQSFDCHSRI